MAIRNYATSNLKSWYNPQVPISKTQELYVNLIKESFMVADAYFNPIEYDPTLYQILFHSKSINILREEARHVLFIKARGISFTYSSLIDLIMTGLTFDNQLIPIISQREESAKETLDVCKWIIEHCRVKEFKDQIKYTEASSTIEFTKTGSKIKVYPSSGAANAIRGRRLIRGMLDEYAFQDNAEELWAACNHCMSHGIGQWLIGSTPNGRGNQFEKFVTMARDPEIDIGMELFDLPIFEPGTFNPKISIHKQPHLVPIAPWLSMPKLERDRVLDWKIFMQEEMCDFLDTGQKLIDYHKIMGRIRKILFNHKKKFKSTIGWTYNTKNPVYMGVDVAMDSDLFAVTIFEELWSEEDQRFYYKQIFLDYFNGKDTPELEEYMNDLIKRLPTLKKCRIDMTGVGTGLVHYLKKTWGNKIEGIKFSQSVYVGDSNIKEGVRKVMLLNLKNLIEQGHVFLLDDRNQVTHLNSVTYDLKVPENKSKKNGEKTGHSDILFADALALLKSRHSMGKSKLKTVNKNKINIKPTTMDVMKRIDIYRKQNKRQMGRAF